MAEIAFAVPIVPGKEDLDRQVLDEMQSSRREEFEEAMREAGLRRQLVWHQETPDGTVAIVYFEGDDVASGERAFASSDAPFNTWFRDQMKEVHGIDIGEAPPQLTKLVDFQA